VAETDQRFDVILIDSTDEIGPGAVLFGQAFYADCRARLRPGGVLAAQFGSCNPFEELEGLAQRQQRLGAAFAAVGLYTATVPTYQGGSYAFGVASDDPAKLRLTRAEVALRAVPKGLRQYSPEVHVAAFVHPPWLAEGLSGGREQRNRPQSRTPG
jgi:spermidine synthase